MTKQTKKPVVPRWLVVVGVILIVGFTGVLLARVWFPQWFVPADARAENGDAEAVLHTEAVISLTSVTSVESSGPVEPLQITEVFWESTGQIQGIHVAIGDWVTADQIVMSLDPASVGRELIQAQVDLINARNTLSDLLNPPAITVANAQNTVALARKKLEDAEYDLRSALNPAGQILYDNISDAEFTLSQAEANAEIVNFSANSQALEQANAAVHQAQGEMQRIQQIYDDGLRTNQVLDQLVRARANYEAALQRRYELQVQIARDEAAANNSVDAAREGLEDAVNDLNYALQGPDEDKVERTRAAVAVAQAELAEAEERLNELLFGADPDDIAAAQAAVLVAEMTLEKMFIQSPFAGEVLAINYRQGDLANMQLPAVTIANTGQLHVTVTVDENDIANVQVGQPATLEFDALAGVTLDGVVSDVGRVGNNVQGIVRYDVDITLLETHRGLLLGMTADVEIVTSVAEGTLAVPIDAIQLGDTGEYVVVYDEATQTRIEVPVVSGLIQGDYVIIREGDLEEGQQVVMFDAMPVSSGSPFGPG